MILCVCMCVLALGWFPLTRILVIGCVWMRSLLKLCQNNNDIVEVSCAMVVTYLCALFELLNTKYFTIVFVLCVGRIDLIKDFIFCAQGSKKASMQLDCSRSTNFVPSRDSSVCVLPLQPNSTAVSHTITTLTMR